MSAKPNTTNEDRGRHWTSESIGAFCYRIASDFCVQMSQRGDPSECGLEDGMLAKAESMRLGEIVQRARGLGLKVSLVLYDDGDAENDLGPINSEIFNLCWEGAGKPRDFWPFRDNDEA